MCTLVDKHMSYNAQMTGGSSGSAILSSNFKVVGLHHSLIATSNYNVATPMARIVRHINDWPLDIKPRFRAVYNYARTQGQRAGFPNFHKQR